MFRSIVTCLPLTVFLLTVSFAEAQQPKKVPRIGLLFPGSQSAFAIWTEVFRQGQRELGIRDLNFRAWQSSPSALRCHIQLDEYRHWSCQITCNSAI